MFHFALFTYSSKGVSKRKEEFEDRREKGIVTKLRERMGFRAQVEGISLISEED